MPTVVGFYVGTMLGNIGLWLVSAIQRDPLDHAGDLAVGLLLLTTVLLIPSAILWAALYVVRLMARRTPSRTAKYWAFLIAILLYSLSLLALQITYDTVWTMPLLSAVLFIWPVVIALVVTKADSPSKT